MKVKPLLTAQTSLGRIFFHIFSACFPRQRLIYKRQSSIHVTSKLHHLEVMTFNSFSFVSHLCYMSMNVPCNLSVTMVTECPGLCYLETDEGRQYVPVFLAVRWHHVVNDLTSLRMIENEKILPHSEYNGSWF